MYQVYIYLPCYCYLQYRCWWWLLIWGISAFRSIWSKKKLSQTKSKDPRSFCWATGLPLGLFILFTLRHCLFLFNASLVSFTSLLSIYQTFVRRICSVQCFFFLCQKPRIIILEGTSWDCLHQGNLQRINQDHSSFKYFVNRDFTISLGNLCQCLTTLTWKQVFACVRMEFPVF